MLIVKDASMDKHTLINKSVTSFDNYTIKSDPMIETLLPLKSDVGNLGVPVYSSSISESLLLPLPLLITFIFNLLHLLEAFLKEDIDCACQVPCHSSGYQGRVSMAAWPSAFVANDIETKLSVPKGYARCVYLDDYLKSLNWLPRKYFKRGATLENHK